MLGNIIENTAEFWVFIMFYLALGENTDWPEKFLFILCMYIYLHI